MLDPQRPAQSNPGSSPAPQARPSRTPALAGAGIGSVGALTAAMAGAPWGAVLSLAIVGLVVVLLQSALHVLIPQESDHRLTWWINLREHRTRRRSPQPQPAPETPPPAPNQQHPTP
ncbi:hypothetical protein OHS70_38420 (plasmid) [Streptomyces sp. NBC_00390]|uniref:hypothetical protein n=1 Tax=Streptomyces sp. NBC_00390 TaxID=2975736 RepID=UPI002E21E9EA